MKVDCSVVELQVGLREVAVGMFDMNRLKAGLSCVTPVLSQKHQCKGRDLGSHLNENILQGWLVKHQRNRSGGERPWGVMGGGGQDRVCWFSTVWVRKGKIRNRLFLMVSVQLPKDFRQRSPGQFEQNGQAKTPAAEIWGEEAVSSAVWVQVPWGNEFAAALVCSTQAGAGTWSWRATANGHDTHESSSAILRIQSKRMKSSGDLLFSRQGILQHRWPKREWRWGVNQSCETPGGKHYHIQMNLCQSFRLLGSTTVTDQWQQMLKHFLISNKGVCHTI